MKKAFQVLVKNESSTYSSETLVLNDKKFKIVARNGNNYSHLDVHVYTQNGDLGLIASAGDIPGYEKVEYIGSESCRQSGNARNIKVAENYIQKVYSL